MPATEERKSIFWLTLMENFGLKSYWLCADTDRTDSGAIYASRTFISGHIAGDSLDCLEWVWRGKPRVTCNTSLERRIISGGKWSQGETTGTYRVILAEENVWGWDSRAVIQWIASSPTGANVNVRAMAELPVGTRVAGREGAQLAFQNGRWCITVRSVKKGFKRLTFALGPPGGVHEVKSS